MESPIVDRRPGALGGLAVLPDEIVNKIIGLLPVSDVLRLACVSSILNVFCNEEPLWLQLCMAEQDGDLVFRSSWRQTVLHQLAEARGLPPPAVKPPLHFTGFSSMYLYRRWYRCHVALDSFAADDGVIDRRTGLSPHEFLEQYDGNKPVILTDLTDRWRAREHWTWERLAADHGEAAMKVSVAHGRQVRMRLRDYAAYLHAQRDEEPLYIFDEKFGELAPGLLADYEVPPHFAEDLFEVMGPRRPPFRWLVAGPARSGASWHVDPALTCAWNALLVGRKRWALYPPGRVPPGVTLHVEEESGDVHFDGPTSLQWWLEVYPVLRPEDRPLEATQAPGETIFVPSGWWHCVLNLEPTIAVTQNLVTLHNLETVCFDMAPGFRHRGIARGGELAAREGAKHDLARGWRAAGAAAFPGLNGVGGGGGRRGRDGSEGGEEEGGEGEGEDEDGEEDEWEEVEEGGGEGGGGEWDGEGEGGRGSDGEEDLGVRSEYIRGYRHFGSDLPLQGAPAGGQVAVAGGSAGRGADSSGPTSAGWQQQTGQGSAGASLKVSGQRNDLRAQEADDGALSQALPGVAPPMVSRRSASWHEQVRALDWGNGLQGQLSAMAAEHHVVDIADGRHLAQHNLREWLRCLWLARPDLRDRVWKCACLSMDAQTWVRRLTTVCSAHGIPPPADVERLPLGTGSNPVYLVGAHAVKLYAEVHEDMSTLGRLALELMLYHEIRSSSPALLRKLPPVIASGVLYPVMDERGVVEVANIAVPWDGLREPPVDPSGASPEDALAGTAAEKTECGGDKQGGSIRGGSNHNSTHAADCDGSKSGHSKTRVAGAATGGAQLVSANGAGQDSNGTEGRGGVGGGRELRLENGWGKDRLGERRTAGELHREGAGADGSRPSRPQAVDHLELQDETEEERDEEEEQQQQEEEEEGPVAYGYLVTRKCDGAEMRVAYGDMTTDDLAHTADFLAEALTALHSLVLPPEAFFAKLTAEVDSEKAPSPGAPGGRAETDHHPAGGRHLAAEGPATRSYAMPAAASGRGRMQAEVDGGDVVQAGEAIAHLALSETGDYVQAHGSQTQPSGASREGQGGLGQVAGDGKRRNTGDKGASSEDEGTVRQTGEPKSVPQTEDLATRVVDGPPGTSGAGVPASGEEVSKREGPLPAVLDEVPLMWQPFVATLRSQQEDAADRLEAWASMPPALLRQLEGYLPADVAVLTGVQGDRWPKPTWLHTDIMDDNLLVVPVSVSDESAGGSSAPPTDKEAPGGAMAEAPGSLQASGAGRESEREGQGAAYLPKSSSFVAGGGSGSKEGRKWAPRWLLDFGNVVVGDPLYDLVAIHLNIFRCDLGLLRRFLASYKLPAGACLAPPLLGGQVDSGDARGPPGAVAGGEARALAPSYRALCYCLLHEQDAMRAVFRNRKDLRTAATLQQVEAAIWGPLNAYAF